MKLKTAKETEIVDRIEHDLKIQRERGFLKVSDLGDEWSERMRLEPRRFLDAGLTIRRDALKNFRRLRVFVEDIPAVTRGMPEALNFINGQHRGHLKMLQRALVNLKKEGFADLLDKYPCPPAGHPKTFSWQGYTYTLLWIKYVYNLGLFRLYIAPIAGEDFVSLDLGSNYGAFSGIVKSEYPKSHHILVDLPEQLSLAHYYLGRTFPEASIATFSDLEAHDSFDAEFMRKHDFILIPWYWYNRIRAGSVDVFTNFSSLQEMSRHFFDYYLRAEPFLSSRIFFMINRYDSAPTYNNGITIKDFPLDDFDKILFRKSPIINERYARRHFILYKSSPYPPHFEFIGKRHSATR